MVRKSYLSHLNLAELIKGFCYDHCYSRPISRPILSVRDPTKFLSGDQLRAPSTPSTVLPQPYPHPDVP